MFLRGLSAQEAEAVVNTNSSVMQSHLQDFRRDFQKINCSHLALTFNQAVKLVASKEKLSINPFCNKAFSFSRRWIFFKLVQRGKQHLFLFIDSLFSFS